MQKLSITIELLLKHLSNEISRLCERSNCAFTSLNLSLIDDHVLTFITIMSHNCIIINKILFTFCFCMQATLITKVTIPGIGPVLARI